VQTRPTRRKGKLRQSIPAGLSHGRTRRHMWSSGGGFGRTWTYGGGFAPVWGLFSLLWDQSTWYARAQADVVGKGSFDGRRRELRREAVGGTGVRGGSALGSDGESRGALVWHPGPRLNRIDKDTRINKLQLLFRKPITKQLQS
jgi:hypothetical protein